MTKNEFVQDNPQTGMLSDLDAVEKRTKRRMFHDIAPKGQAMYDVADRKLNHYGGLLHGLPKDDLSTSRSLQRAIRKSRGKTF